MTDSTPTSAPRMRARRIASRNAGSSAASIVICVKNTMSSGSCARRAISSKRSSRSASSSCRRDGSDAGARLREIGERHRIEVVVGEGDEPEAAAPQFDDLVRSPLDAALARLLAVGAPDRAERAMLRASAHCLHRGPHVALGRQQIPSRGPKIARADAAAVVDAAAAARRRSPRSRWPR